MQENNPLVDYGKAEQFAEKLAHLIRNSTLYALVNPLLEICASIM